MLLLKFSLRQAYKGSLRPMKVGMHSFCTVHILQSRLLHNTGMAFPLA